MVEHQITNCRYKARWKMSLNQQQLHFKLPWRHHSFCNSMLYTLIYLSIMFLKNLALARSVICYSYPNLMVYAFLVIYRGFVYKAQSFMFDNPASFWTMIITVVPFCSYWLTLSRDIPFVDLKMFFVLKQALGTPTYNVLLQNYDFLRFWSIFLDFFLMLLFPESYTASGPKCWHLHWIS